MLRHVLAVAVVLSSSSHARADDAPSDEPSAVVWEAPSECPPRAAVDAALHERLADKSLPPTRVRVSPTSGGYQVLISMDGLERVFDVERCEEAVEATAVIVALALDVAREPPEARAPDDDRGARRAGEEEPRRTTKASVGLAAALDVGSLPSASPGVAGELGLRRGIAALELRLAGYLPMEREVPRQGRAPAGVTIGLFEIMLRACIVGGVASRLEAGGCLGAGAGALHGHVSGIRAPRDDFGARFQGEVVGRLAVRIAGPWSARLEAGVLGDPATAAFVVQGLGDVHRPSPVALRSSAGFAADLW